MYRNVMQLPSQGKWNKSGPALDNVLTQQVFGLHDEVLQRAFGERKHACVYKTSSTDDNGYEHAFLEEVAWHEVATHRITATLLWSRLPQLKITYMRWAILKEPQRFLHRVILHVASERCRRLLLASAAG